MRNAKAICAIFAALMNFQAAVQSQVGPAMRQIKNADGLLIVSNIPGSYFRMQIKGRDASRLHTTKKYWYTSDGVRFEFFSEDNSKFEMTDAPQLDDSVVLRLYRSNFLRRFEFDKPKLRSSWLKLTNHKTALMWVYTKRPAASIRVVEKQIFITIAGPGYVYGLFAPIPSSQSENEIRRVLVRTLSSLTFSDAPYCV